jgi:competence protein ComEC
MGREERALASSFAGVTEGERPAGSWRLALASAWAAAGPSLPLFVPVLIGLGIAGWFLVSAASWRLALLLAGLGAALLGLLVRREAGALVALAGLLVAAGVGAAAVRDAMVAGPRLHHRLTEAVITGTLLSVAPESGGERTRLVLAREPVPGDPPHRVRLTLAGQPAAEVRPGARIAIPATLGPVPGPVLPGGFDPARRAWFEGIAAAGRATGPPVVLAPARPGPGQRWLDGARGDLQAWLMRRLPGDPGAIAVALLVGEQGLIRADLLQAFRVAGLAHILTVSGFHIAVAVGATLMMVRRLVALWPWLALRISGRAVGAVAAGLAGTAYALLSGAEVPAVRAALIAWVVLAALIAGRDPLSPRLIAFAATLILLARPEALLDPSFQLSFAAVTALALFARGKAGVWLLAPRGEGEGLLPLAGRRVAALLATALVAELVLTPIALWHFGQAGLYGSLANLVAIPLTSIVLMPLIAAMLVLAPLGLDWLAALPLAPALRLFAAIAETVAGWPGAAWTVAALPPAGVMLAAAGALLLGLLTGPLRWAGAPLLAAGLAVVLVAPRPDVLVSADGRQVAVAHEGRLWSFRGHRGGFGARAWAEAADLPMDARLRDLPGARCTGEGCVVSIGRRRPLAMLVLADPDARPPAALCAAADLVVAPGVLPAACRGRWRTLDRGALRQTGAVAIRADTRAIRTVADQAGDHGWSPATLSGTRTDLLGRRQWTGVIAE